MKKAVFVNPSFYHNVLNNTNETTLSVFCRNTVLLPYCLGSTFLVHNGKVYLKVYVSENIIGRKLGEFSGSRRRYFFKKGKIKQKGKK